MKHFVQIQKGIMHSNVRPLIFDYITADPACLRWQRTLASAAISLLFLTFPNSWSIPNP